jgi:large repetitive protein
VDGLWLVSLLCIGTWACSSSTGPSTGTVSGGVTKSVGGGISTTVVITPTGGSALPAVQTTPGGAYSVRSVPDGSGSVALSNVPANCTPPSPASYSGLTGGGTVTVNVTVTCTEIAITSGTPPNGTLGAPYGSVHTILGDTVTGFWLRAAGGVPPVTWSWAAAPGSSLPPGLNIISRYASGGSTRCCVTIPLIAGVPTAAGTYQVIVTATDSESPAAQATANYTIVISTTG